jgi:hypothetical protein
MIRRLGMTLWAFLLTPLSLLAFQPPPGQEGFEPLSELPPGEQLPAAPFLIAAYAFFLVLMVLYIWSIGRRLNKVEREMTALEQRASRPTSR